MCTPYARACLFLAVHETTGGCAHTIQPPEHTSEFNIILPICVNGINALCCRGNIHRLPSSCELRLVKPPSQQDAWSIVRGRPSSRNKVKRSTNAPRATDMLLFLPWLATCTVPLPPSLSVGWPYIRLKEVNYGNVTKSLFRL